MPPLLVSPEQQKLIDAVLNGTYELSKNLYKVFARETGNVIFSPGGIHTILALTAQGAEGSTKDALAEAIKIPDVSEAAEGYAILIYHLSLVIEDESLLMANKLFPGYELQESFKQAVLNSFYTDVPPLDFSNAESAASSINGWVEDKTNGKIKDIVAAGGLAKDTRLVLANAVYFLGTWAKPFQKESTATGKFYVNANDAIDVPMMHALDIYGYKTDENLNAKLLEMRYTNEDISLVVILPNERDGIADLEQKLASTDLTQINKDIRFWRKIDVTLPKFKLEQTIDLQASLKELGLGEIFTSSASQPWVSKAIHKVFIEVNEEGPETDAVTGERRVSVSTQPPEEFCADHPFVILLQVKVNRESYVLFTGRVARPKYD